MIKVFLDANVYFAGMLSKDGASAFILELVRRRKLQLFASRLVLLEADRNLRKKTNAKVAGEFRRFLKEIRIRVVPSLGEKILKRYEPLIHPKDVPVLAAAVESKVDFLVTLDRQHFLNARVTSSVKTKILTPGDFLKKQIRSMS